MAQFVGSPLEGAVVLSRFGALLTLDLPEGPSEQKRTVGARGRASAATWWAWLATVAARSSSRGGEPRIRCACEPASRTFGRELEAELT